MLFYPSKVLLMDFVILFRIPSAFYESVQTLQLHLYLLFSQLRKLQEFPVIHYHLLLQLLQYRELTVLPTPELPSLSNHSLTLRRLCKKTRSRSASYSLPYLLAPKKLPTPHITSSLHLFSFKILKRKIMEKKRKIPY